MDVLRRVEPRLAVVGHEHNGGTTDAFGRDAAGEQDDSISVESGRRLVEQENVCLLSETLRHKRPLALTARQLMEGAALEADQSDRVDGTGDDQAIFPSVATPPTRRPARPSTHPDDIRNREWQHIRGRTALRHEGPPHSVSKSQFAVLKRMQPGKYSEEGRLSTPVRAGDHGQ